MEECLSSNGGHVKWFYGLTFDPSNGVENNADKLAWGGVIKQRVWRRRLGPSACVCTFTPADRQRQS